MESVVSSGNSIQPGIMYALPPSKSVASRCFLTFPSANFRSQRSNLKMRFSNNNRVHFWGSRHLSVRASSSNAENSPKSEQDEFNLAPLQLDSPTGQYLSQLLKSHPHLVPAAVEQELERLSENRASEDSTSVPNSEGSDLVLYRRIAELKEQERRTKLEEIIYTLIVQKFVESGIAMVPSLASVTSAVNPWPVQVKELEAVHPLEVLEMIRQHLMLVLGGQGTSPYLDQSTYAQISKLRVGQLYAASIVYGYFLRRIYQRFHLEKSMKVLPPGVKTAAAQNTVTAAQEVNNADNNQEEIAAAMEALKGLGATGPMGFSGMKPSKLQSYIMSIDVEMLQRIATVRSRESLRVLEKHTEALFGRPEVVISTDGAMKVNKDEIIKISFAGLKHLVLEAVAFGSFLWDVESHVDASYAFVSQ